MPIGSLAFTLNATFAFVGPHLKKFSSTVPQNPGGRYGVAAKWT